MNNYIDTPTFRGKSFQMQVQGGILAGCIYPFQCKMESILEMKSVVFDPSIEQTPVPVRGANVLKQFPYDCKGETMSVSSE